MIECRDDRCTLSGPVTLETVLALREAGLQQLTTLQQMTVDLSGVTEVDSSALSLLFEWRRTAQAAGRRIRYSNLPENLSSLAALYGVSDLIEV